LLAAISNENVKRSTLVRRFFGRDEQVSWRKEMSLAVCGGLMMADSSSGPLVKIDFDAHDR